MVEMAPGWQVDVDHGPNWLFVKVKQSDEAVWDTPPLAEQLWALLREHFVDRLVLELDELEVLTSYLVGQLVLLHKRICSGGGIMRVSGLSQRNQEVLRVCRLDGRFPRYPTRQEAVLGSCRPRQPR